MWYHRNGQRYAGLDHRRSISPGKGLDFALSAMGNLWRVLIRKMALSDFFLRKLFVAYIGGDKKWKQRTQLGDFIYVRSDSDLN